MHGTDLAHAAEAGRYKLKRAHRGTIEVEIQKETSVNFSDSRSADAKGRARHGLAPDPSWAQLP